MNDVSCARALAASKWRLVRPVLMRLLVRPRLFLQFIPAVVRWFRSQARSPSSMLGRCVLSPIAVSSKYSGRGVGKKLIRAFADVAESMGADRVHLETEALNNDAVNDFYRCLGFKLERTYNSPGGRLMTEYVLFMSGVNWRRELNWPDLVLSNSICGDEKKLRPVKSGHCIDSL